MTTKWTGAIALSLVAFLAPQPALAGGDRLECDAEGIGDMSMDAKFETRGTRAKFDASFEAAPVLGFQAGDLLPVIVAGIQVGEMELMQTLTGDVIGDLNFDTTAQPDDDDLLLTDGFPNVGAGTSVLVGALGCALE